MKISTDRILTSHVGSLPRPDDAVALLLRKERGEPYDQGEFDRVMRRAVADIVKHQAEIGIDIVSDGEIDEARAILNHALADQRALLEEKS